MNFADNLHYLRKRDKVTQEDLAERLGVSRQSVSKWETGEAYPETDKLIMLCDIFGVSLDDLVRNDLTVAENEQTSNTQTCDDDGFVSHMNKFSVQIALGVFLILFGVGVCLMLCGFGATLAEREKELLEILGGISVILFVAISVFLFIFAGIGHDRFRKEHTEVYNVFPETQLKAFEKRFAVTMASLISGILLDVVLLVMFSCLIDADILTTVSQDAAQCFAVAGFLFILAFLVGGIVYSGIQHGKYHVEEFNRETQEEINPSKSTKIKDGICGVIMLTATAVFLLVGLVWNIWHPTWIAFPVGGILCAIVSTIFAAKN